MSKRKDKKAYTRSLSKYPSDLFDLYMDDKDFICDCHDDCDEDFIWYYLKNLTCECHENFICDCRKNFICDCHEEVCYYCLKNILLEYGIFSGFIYTDYKKEDYKKYKREHKDFVMRNKNKYEYNSVKMNIFGKYKVFTEYCHGDIIAIKQYDCYELLKNLSFLKNHDYVLRKMIESNHFFLKYAPEHIKNDKEFVTNIVSKCSYAFKFISANLRDDEDIATIAINDNQELFKFVSVILRDDKDFVMKILKRSATDSFYIYKYLSDRLKKDSDVVIHSLFSNCSVYYDFSEQLQQNDCLKSIYYLIRQEDKSNLPYIYVSEDILDDMLYQVSIYFNNEAWVQLYKYLEETKKIKHFTRSMRLLDTGFIFA
jgi:hypothetical protein